MCLRKRNTCKWIKNVVITIMATVMIIQPILVQAQEESDLSKSVGKTTQLLEKIFAEQYERKTEEVKQEIESNGYDYTMTMQSFYDQGNPFKGMDYIDFIAKYASVKEYCFKNGIDMGAGLSSMDLLDMSIEKKETEEEVPLLYPLYEQGEDGYYYRTGNQKIEKETEVESYKPLEEGSSKYMYAGKETVEPEKEFLKYGSVTLTLLDSDVILSHFGIGKEQIENAYENRKYLIDREINGDSLTQSVFINLRQNNENTAISEEEVKALIDNATDKQQNILKTAISLLGQVPYEWGGKAAQPGYDNRWWTYDENGNQRGLDCSGFVQWVYMTCGYDKAITDEMISTETMLEQLETISETELEPGDIGLLNLGQETNHTGIYLGDGYFIHCASGEGTVVINQFPFRFFKKIKNSEIENIDNHTLTVYDKTYYTERTLEENISDNDVQLLAQVIEHESGNQGYNGWVAAGEVVVNRMVRYQATLENVIYKEGQFSHVEEISSINPREEIMSVAKDVLCRRLVIFGNPNVLYFRNPTITSNIPAEEQTDWGDFKWYASVNDHAFYTSQE